MTICSAFADDSKFSFTMNRQQNHDRVANADD
jgi:hypothetical protein